MKGQSFQVLDLKAMESQFGNDPELISVILQSSIQTLPKYQQEAIEAINSKDAQLVEKRIHRLKGAVAYFGVSSLREHLLWLEDNSSLINTEDFNNRFSLVVETIERLIDDLNIYLIERAA